MKKTLLMLLTGMLIVSAVLLAGLGGKTGAPTAQIGPSSGSDERFVAGRNVNMVSGKTLPWGDPWLQRQNEPSLAVSSRNPLHLVAGANDYRTIDMPDTIQQVPGLPTQIAAARDAWIGLYKSFDGGQSWITTLLPGYPQDIGSTSPIHGYDTACDPYVRAGANGLFLMSGIAFNRAGGGGAVFVSRFIDNNNLEKVQRDEFLRPVKDSIGYVDTRIIGTGNAGQFLDMPSLVVDVPRGTAPTENVGGQYVPAANAYLAYTLFPGVIDKNARSQLYFSRSTNCGRTWSAPIKISESQQLIQRAVIAIAPNDPTGNTIYVAFRRFRLDLTPDAIVVAKSVDGGKRFSKPVVVSTLAFPFDQMMNENRFRTNSYPSMAVDGNGFVHIAWAERLTHNGTPAAGGQARIVVASSADGLNWGAPQAVELSDKAGPLDGHQVMPSLTYAGGKLMLLWYDQRNTLAKTVRPGTCVTEFIEDKPGEYRQTLDVRAAEGVPALPPAFFASQQVSRYLFYLLLGPDGNPAEDEDDYYQLIQAEHNPVNFPIFQLGSRPFIGDYIDLASSFQFLPPPIAGGGLWKPNMDGANNPTSFHAVWADNRDIRPPSPDWWGDWVTYAPPNSQQPAPDLGPTNPCQNNGSSAGKRNQNVYTASLTNGVQVGSPGNTKQLDIAGGTARGRRTFSVFVRNLTEAGPRTFDLTFGQVQGPAASASFKQLGRQDSRRITLGAFSSAAVTVYVDRNDLYPLASVKVDVTEGSTLVGYVLLNPDGTNLPVIDPDTAGGLGPEDHTPSVSDPKIWKYDLGSGSDPHPGAENPRVQNPRVQNSGLVNPRVQNSSQENPRVQNKNLTNENIVNTETANPRVQNPRVQNTALTDVTWTVTNEGNTTSCFSFDVASNAWAALAPYFEDGTLVGQLLVYRVHTTPLDSGCALNEEHHDELLVNVTNPRVQNPRVQNVAPTAMAAPAEALAAGEDEPPVTDRDATFWLAPDEQAYVIFRVYDKDITDGISFEPQAVAAEVAAEAVNTLAPGANPVPIVVTQPSVPWIYADRLPEIGFTPFSMVSRVAAGTNLASRSLSVWNIGSGTLSYSITVDAPWLSVTAAAGISTSANVRNTHLVAFSTAGLATGQHLATITITDPMAANNPVRIPVSVFVYSNTLPPANEWTARFTTAPGQTEDLPAKVVVDDIGNVYVVGSSGEPGAKDINLVKYDPTGAQVWAMTHTGFTGPTPGNDIATDMVLDQEGNIYVVGSSQGGGDYDFMVIKYRAVGELVWTARYGSGPGLQDQGRAIALDAAGNVYVTGWGQGAASGYDYVTVKFDSNGELVWFRRAPGTGGTDDLAEDIAVDASGNVVVTGTSYENGTENDITTVKYAGDGTPLWTESFARPDSDYGVALAIGPTGNVIVTGRTKPAPQSMDYDIVTLGYSAAGTLLWSGIYDGPGEVTDRPTAIAVDPDGSVYVTGASDSGTINAPNADYVTLKYDPAGALVWEARYNGPGNGEDAALALAVDPLNGDVVVTGYSDPDPGDADLHDFATIKYDSTGSPYWVRRYNGFGTGLDSALSAAIDRAGNVYVTGVSFGNGTGMDYATIKYMPGLEDWSATENGSAGLLDYAQGVAADAEGNIYVTGASAETGRGTDVATIKYDANGNRLWKVLYNGSANGDDSGNDIAVDLSGNVYVTATSVQTGAGPEITTLKYDRNGNLQWDALYGAPGGLTDTGVAIGLTPSGNVVAAGMLGSQNIAAVCYDSNGQQLWARAYQDPDVTSRYCNDLAVSGAGNIYIAGTVFSTASADDYLILKYAGDGNLLWARRYGSPGYATDWAQAMALDPQENVHVTGYGNPLGPGTALHPLTLKFDANGRLLWAAVSEDRATANAIALDASGNVYITGTATIKFDANGVHQWTKTSMNATGNALAVDASGNLYVAGFCDANVSNQTDCSTTKYDPAGNELWTAAHHHPGDDAGTAIAIDPSGNVYVVTVGTTGETTGDIITIKYRQGRN